MHTARAQLCLPELHLSSTMRAGARQVRCRTARRHQHACRRARGACPLPRTVRHRLTHMRTARAQLCLAELHLSSTMRAGARQVRCRTARRYQHARRRARGVCLRQTQPGIASCAHALRGPRSAWQNFTLHALSAQVPDKSAAAAPDATSTPAAELAVRAFAARSSALLPARTHCAGPALLGRTSRYMRCARRCPASPLPLRQTPQTRPPQKSWCAPLWQALVHRSLLFAHMPCTSPSLLD